MALKVTLKYIFAIMIMISLALNSIADDSLHSIIINTVAQHYENPTIKQSAECTESRDRCINDCGFRDEKCQDKCPVCPILVQQGILVEGINDTDYRPPITTSKVNQTSIIRLTNEIRNIINTSLGNITAHNQNNFTIYQKVSRTGGKFGLGYTEKGSCCHLIEPQRCRKSANGPICTHKRLQTCGSHCISRVMRAKRVVTCSETEPDNCAKSVEYLPLRRRPGCQYTSKWPFISCETGLSLDRSRKFDSKSTCSRCFQIPYMNIIRGQVPRACHSCFGRSSLRKPSSSYPHTYNNGYGLNQPIISYPSYNPYSFLPPQPPLAQLSIPLPQIYDTSNNLLNSFADDSNEMSLGLELESDDFKIEEQKCINEDGTIVESCTSETDKPLHFNIKTNLKDESADQGFSDYGFDYDSDEEEITHRRRRQD